MYDVIIIGAGPAGISASLYTQRANLKTGIIYAEEATLPKAKKIENYYGFEEGISGETLYQKGIKQAKNLGVEIRKEEVVHIQIQDKSFIVNTVSHSYETKVIILAMGSKKNKPAIKGIDKLEGKGISYCAICDGFFFKNKEVAIIGNGNYAIAEANELINLVKKIHILTNGNPKPEFRADNVIIHDKKIKEIQGENRVERVQFEDNSLLATQGIFIAQGVAGSSELAKRLGVMTKNDTILVDKKMQTNISGIYACGDCAGGVLQISKAVYEGSMAGMETIKYIKSLKGKTGKNLSRIS